MTVNTGTVSVLVSDMLRSQIDAVHEGSPIPEIEMGLDEITIWFIGMKSKGDGGGSWADAAELGGAGFSVGGCAK